MRYAYALVLLLLFPVITHGQNRAVPAKHTYKGAMRTEMSPYRLNIKGGLTQFFGELGEQDMRSAYGIGLGRNINKKVSINLDYTAGKVGGQKALLFNSYFINEYNTFELTGRWDLTEQFGKNKLNDFHLSVYGGFGLMLFSANSFDITTNELVRFSNSQFSKRNQLFLRWGNPGGKAGIKKTHEGIIPIGTSMDYNLTNRWKLGLDYRFYFVRTDKVDATSGQRLVNPEEADSYSNTPNDKFSLLSVTITHCFVKPHKH